MATSANRINYRVLDKKGEQVGSHSHNVLCYDNYYMLLKFFPFENYTVVPWGYDEEEEEWEGEPQKLSDFLKKVNCPMTRKDLIQMFRNRAFSRIHELFDTKRNVSKKTAEEKVSIIEHVMRDFEENVKIARELFGENWIQTG